MKSLMLMSVAVVISMSSAFAFQGARCAKLFSTPNYLGRNERRFVKAFLALTSTTQFTTSTGKCKLIGGLSEEERQFFVAHNSEQLKKDMIRAEGDYLTTVTKLYGCDERASGEAALRLQQNIGEIYGPDLDFAPLKASSRLDKFMKTDDQIQKLCTQIKV